MNKYEVSDGVFLEQVKQWIDLDGVVYIDIHVIHAPFFRLISSYKDFEELISMMDGRGEITVVRHPDYLLSGIASSDLLEKAIKLLPEGKEWELRGTHPDDRAYGSTYQELKEIFERLHNKYVAICDSHDSFPPSRPPRRNEEILVAEFR